MKGLGKLTYELPSTNILNQVTLEHQYTYSMIENTMHIHTYANNNNNNFFYLFTYTQIRVP